MADYWDAIAFKKTRTGKTMAVRLGNAKQKDDGGWWVNLDAIPAPVDGQYSFVIVPQRDKAATPTRQAEPSKWDAPLDDSIPSF